MRFCQIVPSVIPTIAAPDASSGPAPAPAVPSASCGDSTSSAPANPTPIPIQRRAPTRSPSKGNASSAVSSGCKPVSSADSPAGSPCRTDQNTPAR